MTPKSPTSSASASSRSPARISLAYQGENEDPEEKKDAAAKNQPKAPDRPVRIIYVDPTTGLPLRSVFARANKMDKPIFEATYSYPVDIKVEPPKLDAK